MFVFVLFLIVKTPKNVMVALVCSSHGLYYAFDWIIITRYCREILRLCQGLIRELLDHQI